MKFANILIMERLVFRSRTNEMRLIDADRLKELFIFTCTGGGLLGQISKMIIKWACSFVDEMPTIEAEPVRHGRWILQDTSYWRSTNAGDVQINRVNLKCSVCGWRNYEKKYYNFCPNCGKKMDGGEDDAT